MSVRRSWRWLALGAALACFLSVAHAQERPVAEGDWRLSPPTAALPAVPADDGTIPFGQGLFVQYDALYWAFTPPRGGVIGNPGSEFWGVNQSGVPVLFRNSLDTSWTAEFSWGNRFEIGCVEGDRGWIGDFYYGRQSQGLDARGVQMVFDDPYFQMSGYADDNGDGFDDDLDGDHVYGRAGEDTGSFIGEPPVFVDQLDGVPETPAPADTDDLIYWQAIFDSMQIRAKSRLTGVDAMRLYRFASPWPHGIIDLYLGVRYLNFQDDVHITATGGFLGDASWNTAARNNVVGPQIGARWAHRIGWMTLAAEGRFAPAVNFQDAQLDGYIASNANYTGVGSPANLVPSGFRESRDDVSFAPVGEWRLETAFHINQYMAFRLGYTGMVVGGLTRSGTDIVYSLPAFGFGGGGGGETVLVSAFNFGLEVNR